MRNWFRRRREPDFEPLIAEIRGVDLGTEMDRYRDFRRLFLETEQGKRVLHQILVWTHLWKPCMDRDALILAFQEGERNIGLRILSALHVEPKERPTKTRNRNE